MSERDVIRFYPEQDCYNFDFTPYSQLSVKINAHNYYTLNHYYQAERTDVLIWFLKFILQLVPQI